MIIVVMCYFVDCYSKRLFDCAFYCKDIPDLVSVNRLDQSIQANSMASHASFLGRQVVPGIVITSHDGVSWYSFSI